MHLDLATPWCWHEHLRGYQHWSRDKWQSYKGIKRHEDHGMRMYCIQLDRLPMSISRSLSGVGSSSVGDLAVATQSTQQYPLPMLFRLSCPYYTRFPSQVLIHCGSIRVPYSSHSRFNSCPPGPVSCRTTSRRIGLWRPRRMTPWTGLFEHVQYLLWDLSFLFISLHHRHPRNIDQKTWFLHIFLLHSPDTSSKDP